MENDKLVSIGAVARMVGISSNNLKKSKAYKPYIVMVDGNRYFHESDIEEIKEIAKKNKAIFMRNRGGEQ